MTEYRIVTHLTKEGNFSYFVSCTMTLFMSVFRQNYEVAFFCLILSWSQNNPV